MSEFSIPEFTLADLKEKGLFKFNNTLKFFAQKIAALYGAEGKVTLSGEVEAPRFIATKQSKIPARNEVLTYGQSRDLYHPNVTRSTLLQGTWEATGEHTQPLGIPTVTDEAQGTLPGALTSFTPTFDDEAAAADPLVVPAEGLGFIQRYGFIGMKDIVYPLTGGIATELELTLYYVNERAASLFHCTQPGMGTSDPETVTVTIVDNSNGAFTLAVGDYMVVDDSAASALLGNMRRYEILKIRTIVNVNPTTKTITFDRGQLGSDVNSHTSSKRLYRVLQHKFKTQQLAPKQIVYWPSTAVVAMSARLGNLNGFGTAAVRNTTPYGHPNPGNAHNTPPAPGMRTCLGSMYVIGRAGTLAVAQTADFRIRMAEPHSIRCIYADVDTPPAGSSLTVDVHYIRPRLLGETEAMRPKAKFETLTIAAGNRESFAPDNRPTDRRTPYGYQWPFTTLTAVPPATGEIAMVPDGEFDFEIKSVGSSTAGSNIRIYIQT